MKRIIYSVLIFVFTMALFYLITAFISWELNPKYWEEGARATTGIIGTLISFAFVSLFNGIIYPPTK